MPRKQLDIIKDIFRAHRDKDENLFQERAREYIRYLHWKGYHKVADEIEAILNNKEKKKKRKKKISEQPDLFNWFSEAAPQEDKTISSEPKDAQTSLETVAPPFKPDIEPEKKQRRKKGEVWQVARGAEINFVLTQKLLDELFKLKKDTYTSDEIAGIIGSAKKKSQGFSRLLKFLGLLEGHSSKPTNLAELIFKYDSYFEDTGTLWFLHYFISSQPSYVIWNRIANTLMNKSKFTYQESAMLFEDQKDRISEYSFNHHLRKEFFCFIKAYTESEFRKLNLIKVKDENEIIRETPAPVPDDVLFAAILLFKSRFYHNDVSLEIKTLTQADNSPGKLFYLNEFRFREALERLRVEGFIAIESFANLDQIKFLKTTNYLEALAWYYKKKSGVE